MEKLRYYVPDLAYRYLEGPNMFRATYSGFCSRPRYVPPGDTTLANTVADGRAWPVAGT